MAKLILLLIALMVKDFSTFVHSVRVGVKMFLNSYKIRDIANLNVFTAFFYGLFHDIGKLEISNEIMNKNGKLTVEEFEVIKLHVSNKSALLAEKYFPGIMDHHERLDGSGYIGKSNMSFYVRLLVIVDVEDALRNKRSYKQSMNQVEVQNLMSSMTGKFDELVFEKVMNHKK